MTECICKEWYLNGLGTGRDEMAAVMLIVSLVLDEIGFPKYSSVKSKRTFSDHCKMGMLVLKEHLQRSYRDLCHILGSMPGVMAAGETDRIPDQSTLRKFSARLPPDLLDRVIGETARLLCGPGVTGAFDATGYSMSNASRHYVKRVKQTGSEVTAVKNYAKSTFFGDTKSMAIIACEVSGSNVADVNLAIPVMKKAKATGVNITAALGDKGYDSERIHEEGREVLGPDVAIWIPVRIAEPRSQKSANKWAPGGRWRKVMYRTIDESPYRYRAMIETINSMVKRKMGDTVYGKKTETVEREIKFTVIAHNVRLLLESGWVI